MMLLKAYTRALPAFLAIWLVTGTVNLTRVTAQESVRTVAGSDWCRPKYCPPNYCPPAETPQPSDLPKEPAPGTTETPSTEPSVESILPQVAPSTDLLASATGLGSGSNTPFVGRLDQNNRFNLFDNMSAIPKSRVWFGYQLSDGQSSGQNLSRPAALLSQGGSLSSGESLDSLIRRTTGLSGDITRKGDNHAYRFGVELAVADDFSVAFQGSYVQPYGTDDPQEDFTNPQFMLKWAFHHDCDSVASVILGYSPESSRDGAVLTDDEARLYPGMLAYQDLNADTFLNAGFQFGMPTHGDLYTFDWAVGLGYWMYRHESLCYDCETCDSCKPWILGIIPQFEIFGKHIIKDASRVGAFGVPDIPPPPPMGQGPLTVTPFGGGTPVMFNVPIFLFEEPKHVVDITLGTTIVMKYDLSVSTGVSFPLTGDSVRRAEFIFQVNYGF
jgi:hypothetical protein